MAIHPVVKYPDPVLLRKTEEVGNIGERERILVRDMIETMHAQKGVGLAANQIGIPKRIFVASPDGARGKELVFFNPKILKRSGRVAAEEGCLSIPGYYQSVKRHLKVTLRAQNINGKAVEVTAQDLLARIFQHETDHLDGFLYPHRLGIFKKKRFFKKLDDEFTVK
jgi:peptide deformylase